MDRVDRFGWWALHGGDDDGSMAAGNTSAFNCRRVVGSPSVPSPQSYGRAVDINAWENPYHSRAGWVPTTSTGDAPPRAVSGHGRPPV